MSHIFNLAGEDAEDYLSFAMPESGNAEAPRGGKKTAAARQSKTKKAEYSDIDFSSYTREDVSTEATSSPAKKIAKNKVSQHQTLCMQLTSYMSHFEKAIKNSGLKVDKADTMTVAELEALLQRVRVVVLNSAGPGTNFVHAGALGLAGVIEAKMPPQIADLSGFHSACADDPELEILCTMAAIDYGFAAAMPLPLRLALCVGKIGRNVAINNQQSALIADLQAQLNSQVSAAQATPKVPEEPKTADSIVQAPKRFKENFVYE